MADELDDRETQVIRWDEFRAKLKTFTTAADRVSYASGMGFDFTAVELTAWSMMDHAGNPAGNGRDETDGGDFGDRR